MTNNQQPEYEQVFEDFWKEIVCDENGEIVPDLVKRELYDFWVAIENVPRVYCEITGGQFSKLHTDYIYVVQAAEEFYSRLYNQEPQNYQKPSPAWVYYAVWEQAIAAHNTLGELIKYMELTSSPGENPTLNAEIAGIKIDKFLSEAFSTIIQAQNTLLLRLEEQEKQKNMSSQSHAGDNE